MELECLGSSSAGNCYLLKAQSETLILECGIDMTEVKKALGWSLRSVAGCLVSHRHMDHAKRVKDIIRCGIPVLALEDVFASQGIAGRPFCKAIEPMKGYKAGGFKAFALPVDHDAPCLGFVIDHAEMGKTLFVTDAMMLEYRIAGLRHVMIEANYDDGILQGNIDSGAVPMGLRNRLMTSHMELGTTIATLKAMDLSQASEITLLHLSAGNSDPQAFRERVIRATAKPTYVARKGLKIDFSKEPY